MRNLLNDDNGVTGFVHGQDNESRATGFFAVFERERGNVVCVLIARAQGYDGVRICTFFPTLGRLLRHGRRVARQR